MTQNQPNHPINLVGLKPTDLHTPQTLTPNTLTHPAQTTFRPTPTRAPTPPAAARTLPTTLTPPTDPYGRQTTANPTQTRTPPIMDLLNTPPKPKHRRSPKPYRQMLGLDDPDTTNPDTTNPNPDTTSPRPYLDDPPDARPASQRLPKSRSRPFTASPVTMGGHTRTVHEWCAHLNIALSAVRARYNRGLRGADMFDVLFTKGFTPPKRGIKTLPTPTTTDNPLIDQTKVTVPVRLTQTQYAALVRLSDREGVSISGLCRLALETLMK